MKSPSVVCGEVIALLPWWKKVLLWFGIGWTRVIFTALEVQKREHAELLRRTRVEIESGARGSSRTRFRLNKD